MKETKLHEKKEKMAGKMKKRSFKQEGQYIKEGAKYNMDRTKERDHS